MELVPNIAFGDLSQSSLAEVVAAGFRAFATGTVAVEQGKGESRLFLRYGVPCGALLYIGFRPFTQSLIEQGIIQPGEADRLVAQAEEGHKKVGEILVARGRLTPERVVELVNAHHRDLLASLCLLREGKYELRGWERPPEWTEPIALDPLQAMVHAFSADELFDRRAAILEQLGGQKLRLADDFNDQAARLGLTPQDQQAFARLRTPKTVSALIGELGREDAEAFVAAVALLGLVDAAASTSVSMGTEPVIEDASAFLRPVEATVPPAQAFVLTEETIVEDASAFLRPLPQRDESLPPSAPSRRNPASFPALDVPASRPPASARVTHPDLSAFAPARKTQPPAAELSAADFDDVGLAPPEVYDTPPPSASPARPSLRDEFEFESSDDDEPLELDLQRAPKDMRAQLESAVKPTPAQTRPPASGSRAAASIPPKASGSRPGFVLPPQPRPVAKEEYNPFMVHFRQASVPETLDELDERLDRALRGEAGGVSPRKAAPVPAATAPSLDDELERAIKRRTPPTGVPAVSARTPGPSGPVDILADIAATVGDLREERTGPVTIEETTGSRRRDSDDDLALLAAEEVARAAEVDESATTHDAELEAAVSETVSPAPGQPAAAAFQLESSEEVAAEVTVTPAPAAPPAASVEKTPTPVEGRSGESPDDVRRRLRLRAFRNVAGNLLNRENSARHGVQRPESVPARPALADAELEQDVATRLTKLPTQDHFARLGLERAASTEQVKEAFLSLAKRYHPDRITAMGQNHLLPQVRELFARIKESYDVLVDPASRARYATELAEKEGSKEKLTPEEAKTAFQQGLHHMRRRDFSRAEAEFIRAIAGDPQGEYLAELAWTLYTNPNRRDDAKAEIKDLMARALKSGTENDRTFVVAAHLARADGEHDKAERFFRKAIEKNPKNIEAARELRLIDMRRGTEKKGPGILDRFLSKTGPHGKSPNAK